MPELPEVQTVVDTLADLVLNKEIIDVEVKQEELIAKPSVKEFKSILKGVKIDRVRRRGKYIVVELSNGYYLVTHLRMTGRFFYASKETKVDKYDYIFFKFKEGDELRLGSKRKFTKTYLVDDLTEAGSLTKIGPEPLADDFILDWFKKALAKRRGNIKALLLNQRFLAGLGNIYVDEALFLARVHPLRIANSLEDKEVKMLYKSIRQVLSEGIEHRGTTKWDYVDASGQGGSYQNYLRVYDRAGKKCPSCDATIERIKVGGRSTHFCPKCQPRKE
ncbi:DNA-formamidopyrimidine glycosylase [Halonatronum saccharophilum]|uniref:DNA-formamidopyrimidine glycosylase n=1 Tax=Halonatronum saccharophilum TaxID=150060 RepID=UPI000486D145|nr:DNA-formamidopyrimidine glycosylase [Halonatronum saccharophilum]